MSEGKEATVNLPPDETSFDVQIWKTDKYVGAKVTTHRVRWVVAGKQCRKGFRTKAAADSFRSGLVSALRRGEPFMVSTGLPASAARVEKPVEMWIDFACRYVDMKWPAAAATYRRGIAEALCSVTVALLPDDGRPDARRLRASLMYWAFNTGRRTAERPPQVAQCLDWVASCQVPLTKLTEPGVARAVLNKLSVNLDGSRAAATVVNRKRAVLSNALSYAVEVGLLETNPLVGLRWRAPKASHVVDRRSVANPEQARELLAAVKVTPRSGKRLVAFFALIYYAALRPEEAVKLEVAIQVVR